MVQRPAYVGIDVVKDRVDVAALPTGHTWHINYYEAEIAALVAQLETIKPTPVILESPVDWRHRWWLPWRRQRCPYEKPGIVHHQHSLSVGQVLHNVVLEVITEQVGVPPVEPSRTIPQCTHALVRCSRPTSATSSSHATTTTLLHQVIAYSTSLI